MAIGINWAEVWKPVWAAVWTTVPPEPPAPEDTRQTAAGKPSKRRHRYLIEIDGTEFEVSSPQEALALLEEAKAEAQKQAQVVIERAAKATRRPVRKVVSDAKRALHVPVISVPPDLEQIARDVIASISSKYSAALQSVEIAARLAHYERMIEADDEDLLLLL